MAPGTKRQTRYIAHILYTDPDTTQYPLPCGENFWEPAIKNNGAPSSNNFVPALFVSVRVPRQRICGVGRSLQTKYFCSRENGKKVRRCFERSGVLCVSARMLFIFIGIADGEHKCPSKI